VRGFLVLGTDAALCTRGRRRELEAAQGGVPHVPVYDVQFIKRSLTL